ncbi:hypothetical protein RJ55_07634 [Drechmeria coniospora]|nr:hypothetical protein RJ55_07634 [Drechmeria coniospora]
MATPSRTKDPLEAIQLLVNDVLVQTGKALRASRRDKQGNTGAAHGSLPAKLPETVKAFHAALDDIESDIIRAKSVLLRDLNECRAPNVQNEPIEPELQPMETQPINLIGTDTDPSPPALPNMQLLKSEHPGGKPVAPFPDMGMSLPESTARKDSMPVPSTDFENGVVKVEDDTNAAIPSGTQASDPFVVDTLEMNAGLNFTDMEFTLAPTNNSQEQPNDSSIDLTSLIPADGVGKTLASMSTTLPAGQSGMTEAPSTTNSPGKEDDVKNRGTLQDSDAAFTDMFPGDGQADGMDFDFSLDGGMGGDTFDDLMNDRDNTFDAMEHGDFDATFFGLDKTEGT